MNTLSIVRLAATVALSSWCAAIAPAAQAATTAQGVYVASEDMVTAFRVVGSGAPTPSLAAPVAGGSAVAVSSDGQFVFVARRGSVSAYRVDFDKAVLSAVGAPASGSGTPSSMTLHPNGRFLYVVDNEGPCSSNGNLYGYRVDGTGNLTLVTSIAMTGHPMVVAVQPAGRFAYVANAGNRCTGTGNDDPSIAAFALDLTGAPTGAVTVVSLGFDVAIDITGTPMTLDAATGTIYVTGTAKGTAGFHIGANGLPALIAGFPIAGKGDTVALDRRGTLLTANANDLPQQLVAYRINTDGTLTYQPNATPMASRVTALAADADGSHVYVAHDITLQAYANLGLGQLQPLGSPLTTGRNTVSIVAATVPVPAPPPPPIPDMLVLGHGPSVEPGFERRPLRYDGRAGAFVGEFAGACHAFDMTYGPDGRLYVLDAISRQFSVCAPANLVRRFDGRTGEFQEADDPHANFIPMSSFTGLDPGGFAFGPDGDLYVSSVGTNNVLRYRGPAAAQPGLLVGVFVAGGSGGLSDPGKLRFGRDGHLYVASRSSHQVLKFNGASGAFMGAFAGPDSGLRAPSDLLFGPEGDLYVSSAGNNLVLRFAGPASTTPGRPLGTFAVLPGPPQGLAFGTAGDLFVSAEPGVFRFNAKTGASLGQFAQVRQRVGPLLFTTAPAPHPGLGDFDANRCVDSGDVALMSARLRANDQTDKRFDLTGDGVVNVADARKLALLLTQPGGAPCTATP